LTVVFAVTEGPNKQGLTDSSNRPPGLIGRPAPLASVIFVNWNWN